MWFTVCNSLELWSAAFESLLGPEELKVGKSVYTGTIREIVLRDKATRPD